MNYNYIIFVILLSVITITAAEYNGFEKSNTTKSTFGKLEIPPRSPDSKTGSEFMESVKNMSFDSRENEIREELLSGNIPEFMRTLVQIEETFLDAAGNEHVVKYSVMPDYLAIGNDSDYCRIPMGPITAQMAADSFGACMPTRKLVNSIYTHSEIKLQPVTYTPVGSQNSTVAKFVEHNNAIQNQFDAAEGLPGQLVGGTKKDVVISNRITPDYDRVIIYGWHQLNGNPIQPLYSGHVNYYVDYSHGIRLLDSDIIIDGDTTTIQSVLKDEDLYKLLSDESGIMSYPTYIVDENIPEQPRSFGLIAEDGNLIRLVISPDETVDSYNLFVSNDGDSFSKHSSFFTNEYMLENFTPGSIVYLKLSAENSFGVSPESEVLAVVPTEKAESRILIVNGFDRTSEGNTFDFIRQHASAVFNQNYYFNSATNDAVLNSLFSLSDYKIVDYILGDESTADETFSASEQTLVKYFLENGGRLFVSGSEIAWDLDYRGSSSDKSFIRNYLKAQYSADAPGNVAGTYYSAAGVVGELFETVTDIKFDNGSHGTFDVDYADALVPVGGSESIIRYKNVSTHSIAGIRYEGVFGQGTEPGKLIYLGFPFETVYPDDTRNQIMEIILDYLYSDVTGIKNDFASLPTGYSLHQNYPNPFNPSTTIKYSVPSDGVVSIKIYNTLGQEVKELVNEYKSSGSYQVSFNASLDETYLPSGTYFCRMTAGEFSDVIKMILIK